LAAYAYTAAGAGESTTEVSWDGQAEIFENGALLAETERFPTDAQTAVADVDLDLLRQERMRMGTFDDNRRNTPAAGASAASASGWTRRPATSASSAASSASPSCPPTPSASSRTATRRTTSRSPGWCSG
jgi:NAD+ synthase (glutamine-hydrolysing)